ncbi:MAG: prepilin-type N-terminal cleavage/methylation domain-containing protein [Candidatus Falkowbacteria bacterium]
MFKQKKEKGFTLIELLIVIAIIAIIAAVAFVALDPLTRFRDARDSARWADVSALVSAIKVDQVDNKGTYAYGARYDTSNSAVVAGTEYMISTATTTTGCNASACSAIAGTADCVNLYELVTDGYLGALPISPNGSGSWSSTLTGYYFVYNSNGSVTVTACEAENTSSISLTR